ncbi:cation-transporting P-type ATPase [Rhizobium sp. ARZ01]|uniref:cation-transporting P-type ATPase n=1 Tax=Rhizobium sp. ARZ01 TaxID=2769313 RepID=UPI00177B52EB|nr:cation-transporting P-type ATPase [Rhizobium sp. ARZ01]MBD9372673.1 cation-transporting P-type ATPase [Rhizobium sp. ARZ01]
MNVLTDVPNGNQTVNGVLPKAPWHALPAAEIMADLGTSDQGLDPAEAKRRLEAYGLNEPPAPPPRHPLLRFLSQFNNTLIYFLLAAAVMAAILGHTVDASVIVGVVLVNAIVGFLQEGKAESALNAIRDMIAPHARVLRGGQQHDIDTRNIVPGDVVLLEAGDMVPADIRLMRARNLLVNEAILTGESVPAEKHEEPVADNVALGDRFSMLYSGTIVSTGQATGVAVATGDKTEIGRISAMIGEVQTLVTPLLEQINRFGRIFTVVAMAMAAAIMAFAMLVHQYPWVDALMVVVALAVGAVPEGLPAVITITLAIGVQRMARRNAVVRRLPAVETLGAVSVICSDKTGTLTKNEMTARRVATADRESTVSSSGYAPAGRIGDGTTVLTPTEREVIRAALLCSDAQLVEKDGRWSVLGDPMEGALVTLALKAGLHPETERGTWSRIDEIPFDAQHRFMATLNRDPAGGSRIFVKGAPERVLSMCARQAGGEATAIDAAYWQARIAAAAANGERVLGFAAATAPAAMERLAFEEVETGLVFLGIVGFIDPPRDEAIAAVADCRSAGIAVKMITGDHADTAAAISRQLAIADDPRTMTGAQIDEVPDRELGAVVEETSVFARTSPEHKLRIVRALQSNGHVVAMTGDGVNDAPSLKQADVGIAMGRKGTEAAKEAAQMVLVDDNFASIVAAVNEGRTVFDNIRKVIAWTMPTNGGEVLSVVLAIVFGLTLPMTPAQILWINMITTVTLGLVLAFEPPEPNVMQRPPRGRNAPLVTRFLAWRIVFVSILFTIGVFGIFEYAMRNSLGEDTARTMVVNTMVVMEIFYLFNVRYLHMTSFNLRGVLGTPAVLTAIAAVVIAQFTFTYAPFMHPLFDSAPVRIGDGMIIIAIGIVMMAVLEAEKAAMRRLGALRPVEI